MRLVAVALRLVHLRQQERQSFALWNHSFALRKHYKTIILHCGNKVLLQKNSFALRKLNFPLALHKTILLQCGTIFSQCRIKVSHYGTIVSLLFTFFSVPQPLLTFAIFFFINVCNLNYFKLAVKSIFIFVLN